MSDEPSYRAEPTWPAGAGRTPPTAAPAPLSESIPADKILHDQLARIEDKVARVEEKYARSEALLLRVEDRVEHTTGVTSGLARQDELERLVARVGRLPGFGALIATAIIAAVLAAIFVVLAQRFGIPGLT